MCSSFFKQRLAHAIIFEGFDDFQLNDICDFLSYLIFCENNSVKNGPCKVCKACKKVKANTHPDIVTIEAALSSKSIYIDDIRKIISDAYIIPSESNYKLFIIKNSETMTIQAQNALLKLLEEPPKGVFLVLTCKALDSILTTIKSRAQIFTLSYYDSKYNTINDHKALNLAEQLLNLVAQNNQFDFLLATSNLVKNKEIFKQTLLEMQIIIHSAITFYFTQNIKNTSSLSQKLSEVFDVKQLIFKENTIIDAYNNMDLNVNHNLNLTNICIKLFDNY